MGWINEQSRPLVQATLQATAGDAGPLPPGEHEIRIGIDGSAAGMQFAAGLHGRLLVSRQTRSPQRLIERALGLCLAKVPAATRAVLVKQLAKLAADESRPQACPKETRRVLSDLRRRVGVTWRETPTYKPRG